MHEESWTPALANFTSPGYPPEILVPSSNQGKEANAVSVLQTTELKEEAWTYRPRCCNAGKDRDSGEHVPRFCSPAEVTRLGDTSAAAGTQRAEGDALQHSQLLGQPGRPRFLKGQRFLTH